jgi:hypothetical protein
MAKITEITLKKTTDWAGIAQATLTLLAADEPAQLDADARKALIERYTPKADTTVTMHTSMDYGQAMDWTLKQEQARKGLKKGERYDEGWFTVSYFVTAWTLKDAETGEIVPFTLDGFRHAKAVDASEIIDLCNRVAAGVDPNA